MVLLQPCLDVDAHLVDQSDRISSLAIGDGPRPGVGCDVAPLSQGVQLLDRARTNADGVSKRLENDVVVPFTCRGAVARRSQGNACGLEDSAVGDVEAPIWTEPRRPALAEVLADHVEELGDLSRVRLVGHKEPFTQPVL